MYCVKCGVKLAEGEKVCPLCGTTVFHPDLPREDGERLFPPNELVKTKKAKYIPQIFLTFAVVFSLIIILMCDLRITGGVTWSGYVIGGLLILYVSWILPSWFARPNPVIFVPAAFLTIGLYLLYIDIYTGGKWFLSFAFPITGGICILITALIALLKYVKRGKLYSVGGFLIALGSFMLLTEFLADKTFSVGRFIGWSLYPMVALCLLGGFLIFLAIYRPAKETMERKFFI